MRWTLADVEVGGQTALFESEELVGPERGTGRLSGLEFLAVRARRIINQVPATSHVPFRWTINAYRGCSHACTYCFARPTHEYLGLDAGSDFDQRIVVKINAVERLQAELRSPRWTGEHIAMGTNTDPYQRAEGKYRLTRGLVQALGDAGNPFSILTKSALVARDVDVLAAAAARTSVSVSFSVGTLDEAVWRASEPGTPHPRRRLDAMRVLSQAGIRVGALIAPILPGLSDRRAQLDETVAAILDAGGSVTAALPLYLRGATREHFLSWLADYDPVLYERYRDRYRNRVHLGRDYHDWVAAAVRDSVAQHSPSTDAPAHAHRIRSTHADGMAGLEGSGWLTRPAVSDHPSESDPGRAATDI